VLNQKIRGLWDTGMRPVGRSLSRTGLDANTITAIGVLVQAIVAYLIIADRLFEAGMVAILAALADTLDGAVAKAQAINSRFGALLDSTADRFCDALFFVPIAWLYGVGPSKGGGDGLWISGLALAALVFSFLVSYVKARAEGLGYKCNVGIIERAERLILMILGLLLADFVPGVLAVILGALAVFSAVTVVQRLLHVRTQARGAA
jgi:CDP-diacylglycerol---glycerol-3-phosphate 3-phosphatidyltransferase